MAPFYREKARQRGKEAIVQRRARVFPVESPVADAERTTCWNLAGPEWAWGYVLYLLDIPHLGVSRSGFQFSPNCQLMVGL